MRGRVLKLYVGPVNSKKLKRLIQDVEDLRVHSRNRVIVIQAIGDENIRELDIEDCDGKKIHGYGIPLKSPHLILELLQSMRGQGKEIDIIAMDAVHLFNSDFGRVVEKLLSFGKSIIASGLKSNSKREPYPSTWTIADLCANPSQIEFCHSWCRCGAEAHFSQKIPGKNSSPASYEPRCENCFEPPEESPLQN